MYPEYYIVVNDLQQGPFTKEALRLHNISPDTLVWRSGLQDWVKASALPELEDILVIDVHAEGTDNSGSPDNGWYAMIGGIQKGPATIEELISMGLTPDTPVWHNGLAEWVAASSQSEIINKLGARRPPHYNPYDRQSTYGQPRDFSNNPQYGPRQEYPGNSTYGNQPGFSWNPQYGNDSRQYGRNNTDNRYNNGNIHTNWLPWAIVATVTGFIFSCIGAVFGVIAIIQANKANGFYAAGDTGQGDGANNTAKTMTIIGLVLAGIGLVTTVFWWSSGGLLSYL